MGITIVNDKVCNFIANSIKSTKLQIISSDPCYPNPCNATYQYCVNQGNDYAICKQLGEIFSHIFQNSISSKENRA